MILADCQPRRQSLEFSEHHLTGQVDLICPIRIFCGFIQSFLVGLSITKLTGLFAEVAEVRSRYKHLVQHLADHTGHPVELSLSR